MKALSALKGNDWSVQFEAINTLRGLLSYHPQAFHSPITVHNLLLDMLKMVNSLRSSLSKNGLIFIREISSSIPKAVEGEMFTIIPGIMRRSIDTNVFISDEAE